MRDTTRHHVSHGSDSRHARAPRSAGVARRGDAQREQADEKNSSPIKVGEQLRTRSPQAELAATATNFVRFAVAPVSSGARGLTQYVRYPTEPSEDARARDATQDASSLSADLLDAAKHASFVVRSSRDRDTLEYVLTEHLRMSGVYWGLTALDLMSRLDEMDLEPILAWLQTCRHASGGYGGSEGHDPHILYTLSAVQICALCDRMDLVDADAVASYCASLQNDDGSFSGDVWGEIDTRFTYCALSACRLVGRPEAVDVAAAARYVARCKNFDGGFGCEPGGESHAGQIFTCVGGFVVGGRDARNRRRFARVVAVRAASQGGWFERPAGEVAGRVLQLVGVVESVRSATRALDRPRRAGVVHLAVPGPAKGRHKRSPERRAGRVPHVLRRRGAESDELPGLKKNPPRVRVADARRRADGAFDARLRRVSDAFDDVPSPRD